MRSLRLAALALLVFAGFLVGARADVKNAELHGPWSAAVPPFHVVGNIYYVGAANIASYLVVTPEGNVLLDSGTREMPSVIAANIAKLGFKVRDVKILLAGHAHFDHVGGHAAMQRLTGAKVMALGDDAIALASGKDRSPLGDEGWDPVKVDRVLADGDTVSLGGTTLTAHAVPGHTPGCTVWTMPTRDGDRSYSVAFFACAGPNQSVKLVGNPRFPHLVDDTLRGFATMRGLHPDIFLAMHPREEFEGKVDKMAAGVRPHPLDDPAAWTRLLDELEADFKGRVEAERRAAK